MQGVEREKEVAIDAVVIFKRQIPTVEKTGIQTDTPGFSGFPRQFVGSFLLYDDSSFTTVFV